jgi:hypothetical protein
VPPGAGALLHGLLHGTARSSAADPRDLVILDTPPIIVEAKIVGRRSALSAIREAIGQLWESRYFCRSDSQQADLCILLDRRPDEGLVPYLEDYLAALIAWWDEGSLVGGPKMARKLARYGLR